MTNWKFSFEEFSTQNVEDLSSLLGVLGNFCSNPSTSNERKQSFDSLEFHASLFVVKKCILSLWILFGNEVLFTERKSLLG